MIHTILMKISQYIAKNKINITEFAKAIGVKRNSVYRYQRGRRPSDEVITKIIQITEGAVTLQDFFPNIPRIDSAASITTNSH